MSVPGGVAIFCHQFECEHEIERDRERGDRERDIDGNFIR